MTTTRTRVYLAGPMFSAGDKFEQLELAKALAKAPNHYEVHAPQRDGIEVASVMGLLNDPRLHNSTMLESVIIERLVTWVTRTVVALDVYQSVEGCQCVVLNLDGRVPDEGSLVEATLSWYVGVPVIPYKTTPITELGFNENPMVDVITGWAPPCSTVPALVKAVDAATASAPTSNLAAAPSHIQSFCELGRTIWKIRKRRAWTSADVTKAVAELSALPAEEQELIEPVPKLQPIALEVVVAIIEFSRLSADESKQKKIVKKVIKDAQKWSADATVRQAILDNPSTA